MAVKPRFSGTWSKTPKIGFLRTRLISVLSRENLSIEFQAVIEASLPVGSKDYRKVPKFSDARKICCNLPKIQTKSPNLRVFRQKDANGIANSEDPDQTAPLGAV